MKPLFGLLNCPGTFKSENCADGVQYNTSYYKTREAAMTAAGTMLRANPSNKVFLFEATGALTLPTVPLVMEKVEE